MIERDPHDYTLEVCVVCGAQLDRYGNGRCPVDRSHRLKGGMVVRVLARPADEQDDVFQQYRRAVPPHAMVPASDAERS